MNLIKKWIKKFMSRNTTAHKSPTKRSKWTKKVYDEKSSEKNFQKRDKKDFQNNRKSSKNFKERRDSDSFKKGSNSPKQKFEKRKKFDRNDDKKAIFENVQKISKKAPSVESLPEDKAYLENTELFGNLGLNDKILAAIDKLSYSEPTEIQSKAIPVILEGKDIIGTAQTGTGKTAAFSLPILQRLDAHESVVRCLILAPTRELAAQISTAIDMYSKHLGLRCVLVQGGTSMQKQLTEIAQGADIIVATPGRILDYIKSKAVSLSSIKYLIMDEVDRMFDMGFIEDVSAIISACPKDRQTLFFSATMPDAVQKLSSWALKNPERIEIGLIHTPAETIDHCVYPVDRMQKYDFLLHLLNTMKDKIIIVFTRTRMDADRIGERLTDLGFKVSTLHSDKSQKERDASLKNFKDGNTNILVATDIASRGLDISNVAVVINYNVPEHSEDYVHRIGRTGRAKQDGKAITLYSSDEFDFLARIERFINNPIERRKLDDFEYLHEPILNTIKKARKRNR